MANEKPDNGATISWFDSAHHDVTLWAADVVWEADGHICPNAGVVETTGETILKVGNEDATDAKTNRYLAWCCPSFLRKQESRDSLDSRLRGNDTNGCFPCCRNRKCLDLQ